MKKGFPRICLLAILLLLTAVSCAPKKTIYSQPAGQQAGLPGHKAQDPAKAQQKYTKHLGIAKQAATGNATRPQEYTLDEKSRPSQAAAGQDAYTARLIEMVKRTDLDWTSREAAGMELADHFWSKGEYGLSFDALGVLYHAAPDNAAKTPLEADALRRAESLPLEEQTRVLSASLGADPNAYPWSMVTWAQSMKLLAQDKNNWTAIWPSLSAIVRTGNLANKDFFAGNLRALESQMGVAKPRLALLLPLSGPYAQVGWKIAGGANTAWRENRAQTAAPEIQLINTESPTFLDELRAVTDVPIIGGPLRKDIWEKIRVAGLHRSARFLTFLPNVEDEGVEAWRFFSSPADQVRALMQGCAQLGVASYGILHPQDRFGTSMTEIFQTEAKALGAHVASVRDYDLGNPPTWGKAVAAILGASGGKNAMNPEPPFQAVFLPDSLFRVQQLAPLFHYYEETRLIFLGPQLWTQSLADSKLEMQYFELTIFPGAWDADSTTQSAQSLKQQMPPGETADLWTALGYDFVRFAALVGTGQNSAPEFNRALALAASRMSWSQAPMFWDNGRASQQLFLFQPTVSGMVLADMEKISQTREQHQQLREARQLQIKPKQ